MTYGLATDKKEMTKTMLFFSCRKGDNNIIAVKKLLE